MGLFDFFTRTERPDPSVPAGTADEVYDAILGVAGPDTPYTVRSGEADGVDLVAEWQHEAQEARGDGRGRATTFIDYRILMRLDGRAREVRFVEKMATRTRFHRDGTTVEQERSQGPITRFDKRYRFGRDENGRWGFHEVGGFSTGDLKRALGRAALGAGWVWESGFTTPGT